MREELLGALPRAGQRGVPSTCGSKPSLARRAPAALLGADAGSSRYPGPAGTNEQSSKGPSCGAGVCTPRGHNGRGGGRPPAARPRPGGAANTPRRTEWQHATARATAHAQETCKRRKKRKAEGRAHPPQAYRGLTPWYGSKELGSPLPRPSGDSGTSSSCCCCLAGASPPSPPSAAAAAPSLLASLLPLALGHSRARCPGSPQL